MRRKPEFSVKHNAKDRWSEEDQQYLIDVKPVSTLNRIHNS